MSDVTREIAQLRERIARSYNASPLASDGLPTGFESREADWMRLHELLNARAI